MISPWGYCLIIWRSSLLQLQLLLQGFLVCCSMSGSLLTCWIFGTSAILCGFANRALILEMPLVWVDSIGCICWNVESRSICMLASRTFKVSLRLLILTFTV